MEGAIADPRSLTGVPLDPARLFAVTLVFGSILTGKTAENA
jgi:hypothetical protein